jgi:hypothetical protein
VRRQGLALRVTRRFHRSHDSEANYSFSHAHVRSGVGQERRATAMWSLWDNRFVACFGRDLCDRSHG